MLASNCVLGSDRAYTRDDATPTWEAFEGLGSVETTVERRAAIAGQQHLPPTLLRLSVGCEHVEDLWSDLDSALGA